MVNIPVVNAPYLSVSGMEIAITGNTAATVAAGSARNSSNLSDIIMSATATLDATVNGINGLDTGSLAASKVYALYAIGDSTGNSDAGIMISLNQSAPQVPSEYDMYRKIGYLVTDASVHFLPGYFYGSANDRMFMYDARQATAVTAGTSATYAAVTLTALVPAQANLPVKFEINWTANAAADTFNMQPFGATGDAYLNIAAVAGATAHTVDYPVIMLGALDSGAPKVNYKVSAGTVAIDVMGFEYSI